MKIKNAIIYNDDCLSWFKKAKDNSIDAIVTDPPYGVKEFEQTQLDKKDSGQGGIWRIPPSFDGHVRSPLPRFTALNQKERLELRDFFTEWSRGVLRILKPGAHVFVASNSFLSQLVFDAITDGGLEFRGEIIRLVRTLRGGDRPKNAEKEFPDVCSLPRGCYEPWGLFRKPLPAKMTVSECLRQFGTGGLRRKLDGTPFNDVIMSERTPQSERAYAKHPSLKPQSLLRELVYASLPTGKGIVLDPFMGSGSTLAAAEAIGYKSIGIERSVEFFELAKLAIPKLSALKTEMDEESSLVREPYKSNSVPSFETQLE